MYEFEALKCIANRKSDEPLQEITPQEEIGAKCLIELLVDEMAAEEARIPDKTFTPQAVKSVVERVCARILVKEPLALSAEELDQAIEVQTMLITGSMQHRHTAGMEKARTV